MQSLRKSLAIKLLVLFLASCLMALALSAVDFTETFHEFSRAHEDWELDELILAIFFFSFGLLLLFFQNVTENLEVEDKLAVNSHQLLKYRNAIMQMNESVIITDQSGRIEFVNPAFSTITGYSEDDVVGKDPSVLKSSAQDPKYYDELWQTISRGEVWKGELIDRKKDGSFYPAEMTISPLFREDGSISHYIAVQQDVSEKRELEERFHHMQKMEAIGTLVGGIAHDFNNTLSGISANAFLAKRKASLPDDTVRRLETIESLSFGAGEMISKLLSFARKGVMNMVSLEVTSLFQEAMETSRLLVSKNVTLTFKNCISKTYIKGDADLLYQVMMNLINNACDAVEEVREAPSVTVTVDELIEDDLFISRFGASKGMGFVHVAVSDNGIGIDAETIQYIFDPYFTTKEQGKGTGLGLAMIFGTVKSHNGYIDVESEPGLGSTFHLYLPVIQASLHQPEDEASREETFNGNMETILFVDDNDEINEGMTAVIRDLNYRVLSCSNGREGLELYKQHLDEISLVVMDVVMPVMSGPEAAKTMREINPDVKIILISGYDLSHELDDEINHDELIHKPFSIRKISETIYRTIYA